MTGPQSLEVEHLYSWLLMYIIYIYILFTLKLPGINSNNELLGITDYMLGVGPVAGCQ